MTQPSTAPPSPSDPAPRAGHRPRIYPGENDVSGADVVVLERRTVEVVAGEWPVLAGAVVDDVDGFDVEVDARGTVVVVTRIVGRTVVRGEVRGGTVCSVNGDRFWGDDTASGRTST